MRKMMTAVAVAISTLMPQLVHAGGPARVGIVLVAPNDSLAWVNFVGDSNWYYVSKTANMFDEVYGLLLFSKLGQTLCYDTSGNTLTRVWTCSP